MARSTAPRTKIAAVGTLAALSVLAAVATASRTAEQQRPPKPVATRTAPVHTVVVRRTVGVLTRFVPPADAQPAPSKTPAAAAAAPAPVAAPAAAARHRSSATDAEPADSEEIIEDVVPEAGAAEDECLAATAGGAPDATTVAVAATPATAVQASMSARARRALRRAERRARRAERRARRAERRARRAAARRAARRIPARTTHPLPQDVPGAVLDACGSVAPVPATTAGAPVSTTAQVVAAP